MPPVVLAALLAFHCSEQVCSRAKPGFSLAYFGSTAVGNTALPTGAAGAAGLASGAFGTAGAGGGGGGGGARGGGGGGRCVRAALGFAEVVPLLTVERARGLGRLIFRTAFLRGQRLRRLR